jgi:hypothetical protein
LRNIGIFHYFPRTDLRIVIPNKSGQGYTIFEPVDPAIFFSSLALGPVPLDKVSNS